MIPRGVSHQSIISSNREGLVLRLCGIRARAHTTFTLCDIKKKQVYLDALAVDKVVGIKTQ